MSFHIDPEHLLLTPFGNFSLSFAATSFSCPQFPTSLDLSLFLQPTLSMPRPGGSACPTATCSHKSSDNEIPVRLVVSHIELSLRAPYSLAFVDMLNQMRIGIVEPATVEQFTQLERPLYYDDGLEPMQLYVFRTT